MSFISCDLYVKLLTAAGQTYLRRQRLVDGFAQIDIPSSVTQWGKKNTRKFSNKCPRHSTCTATDTCPKCCLTSEWWYALKEQI